MQLLSRDSIEQELSISLRKIVFLVTLHPLTTEDFSAENQLSALLSALDACLLEMDCSIIFTKANADNGGRGTNQRIEDYVMHKPHCYLFDSLGQLRYLSIMNAGGSGNWKLVKWDL